MIVEELYDALKEAGASEEKARAASRAIADMQGHFGTIEKHISEFRTEVQKEISDLRADVRLLNWMLGAVLAFLIAVFFKVFSR